MIDSKPVLDTTEVNKAKEAIQKIIDKSEDDFEKQLTFIASGALGITFTFLEKVITLNGSIHLWALALGWSLLAVSLCVNLVSHYYSKRLAEKSIEEYQSYCDSDTPDTDGTPNTDGHSTLVKKIKDRNKRIDSVNYLSIGCLFSGIFSIIIFVIINLNHVEKEKAIIPKRNTDQTGRIIPIPPPAHQQPTVRPPANPVPNK